MSDNNIGSRGVKKELASSLVRGPMREIASGLRQAEELADAGFLLEATDVLVEMGMDPIFARYIVCEGTGLTVAPRQVGS